MSDDADIGTLPAWPELPEGRPRTTLDLAAAKLRAAIQETPGFVLVTAENARVSEALFLRIEPELRVFRSVRVSGRNLEPDAVVKKLWKKVEPTTNPPRAAVRLMIDRARTAGHPIVVAIADADDADPARLEKLRVVLEGAPDAGEIVRIVLLGGPGLVELLRTEAARAVAIRIGASVNVPTATSALVNAAVIVEAPTTRRRRISIGGVVAVAALAGIAALVFMGGVVAYMSSRPAIESIPTQIAESKFGPPPVPAPAPKVPDAPPPAAESAPVVPAPAPTAQTAPATPPAPAPSVEASPPTPPAPAPTPQVAAEPAAEPKPDTRTSPPVVVPPPDSVPTASLAAPEPQVGLPKVEPAPAPKPEAPQAVARPGVPAVPVPPDSSIPTASAPAPEPHVGLPEVAAAPAAKPTVPPSPAPTATPQPAPVATATPPPAPIAKEVPPPAPIAKEAPPPQAPVATLATPEPETPPALLDEVLQVGAFRVRDRAEAVRKQLAGRFPSVTINPMTREGETLYRVRVGGFRSPQDLGLAAAALRTDGWETMRVRP